MPKEKKNKPNSVGGVTIGNNAELKQVQIAGQNIYGNLTIQEGVSGEELLRLKEDLAPIRETVKDQNLPKDKVKEAEEKINAIEDEAKKGTKKADDNIMANLITDLVDLVPGAVRAVATAFGQPILGAISGPATKFVIDRLKKSLPSSE